MDSRLILLLALLFLSGFFSWSELALISLSEAKLRSTIKHGNKTALIVQKLRKNSKKLLITILICNNFVNILASVITTVWVTNVFWSKALWLVTGILTILILIFGEIFPKVFAEKYPLRFSLIVAKPIYILYVLLTPLSFILEKQISFMLKATKAAEEEITEDELKEMVSFSAEAGAIQIDEGKFIKNILKFDDIKVEQVMTDKSNIIFLENTISIDKAIKVFVKEGVSRIPVYKNNKDNIVWILSVKDLLKAKSLNLKIIKEITFTDVFFIPETKFLDDLLKEFQWNHKHMAIVIDEFGSVTGIITMEDLLEEIIGDINDETDEDENNIQELTNWSWRVNVEEEVSELNLALNTVFDVDEHKNISYLLLEAFQKIPKRGESIDINWFSFFIEKMDRNKIKSVRIIKN